MSKLATSKSASDFPSRRQFDKGAQKTVLKVFEHYEKVGKDFGSHGHFKNAYCLDLASYLNSERPGMVEVVCSGTVAIYVALKALELKDKNQVLVSPITDPGMISPIVMMGLRPKILDLDPKKNYQVTLDEIKRRFSPEVGVIILNHFAGYGIDEIQEICDWARENKIYVIEDISQAHGAKVNGKKVGTFGDIACLSTMFSKSHSTGGAGGVLYTENHSLYEQIILHSQKGKPFFLENFNEKNPNEFVLPALNLGLNEISHALGSYTLSQLDSVNSRRSAFLQGLRKKMDLEHLKTKLIRWSSEDAPFFAVLLYDQKIFGNNKIEFGKSIAVSGVPLNVHYEYQVYEWPWLKPYLADNYAPTWSLWLKNNSFNLLFNENCGSSEVSIIIKALQRAEATFSLSNK